MKKKRWGTKTKRGIRAPARGAVDDEGHNEENHLQQDGSDDEMDTEAYVPHGWGAFSGSGSRA